MDRKTLRRGILNLRDTAAAPTADCPDDHQIALWVSGSADAESRRRWFSHIAGCDYCVARIGRVNRLRQAEFESEVPQLLLARAVRAGKSARVPGAVRRWAAAAVVVLAVGLLLGRQVSGPDPLTAAPDHSTPGSPQSRTIDPDAMRPLILSPLEGSGILAGESLIRWRGIPGSLYYEVRLVSADGGMIWQERVATPEWRLPGDLKLVPGDDYFVRVDAYLAEAKSVNSRHVKFHAGKPR